MILSAIICALGNRAWGSSGIPHWVGAVIMAIGITIAHPVLWAFPFYLAGIFIWRAESSRPWLHVGQYNEWRSGIVRGLFIIPLALIITAVTNNPFHMLSGLIAIFAVPAAYWLGFKFPKYQTEISEVLAGLIIGAV